MPFEFTGKSPALLGVTGTREGAHGDAGAKPNPSASAVFGSTASFGAPSPSSAVTSFGAISSFGTPPSFGASSPFGARPSFGTSLSFGRAASPWATAESDPSTQPTLCGKQEQASEGTDVTGGDESHLGKALRRAALQRPAFLGVTERGADDVLQEFGDFLQQPKTGKGLPTLSKELNTLAQQYPQTAAFVHFLFEKSAKLQGERPREAPKQVMRSSQRDLKEEEDTILRRMLQPAIHDKLVSLGLANNDRNTEGLLRNGHSHVHCQIALKSSTYDALTSSVEEEWLDGKDHAVMKDFAQWLWEVMGAMRAEYQDNIDAFRQAEKNTVESETAAAAGIAKPNPILPESIRLQKTDADPLSAFLGKADAEGKLAAKLKSGGNVEPAYYTGVHNADAESRRCCKRTTAPATQRPDAVSSAEKHKPQGEEDTKLLKTWLVTKLKVMSRADANEEVLAEFIVALIKPDEDEAAAKASCTEALTEFLGSGTQPFINNLLIAITTRGYNPDFVKAKSGAVIAIPTSACASTEINVPGSPFRFMDLPAELRTWVYREALVPGLVRLLSCKHGNPSGVTPLLTVGLLATSYQINDEAKGLLFENTFMADSYPAFKLKIKPKLIPHHVLPQLTSMTLGLEIALKHDWRQMQAMTGLLAIRLFGDGNEKVTDAHCRDVIQNILESLSATCYVSFGNRVSSRESDRSDGASDTEAPMNPPDSVENLNALVIEIGTDIVRGAKSGQSCLFYFDSAGALRHI
ncbi:hypothetical protein LTR85_000956 [Meristemomyces frigidus]|nr:hypothetical protein LTR85_000956 [Meristemomyces frigidus]